MKMTADTNVLVRATTGDDARQSRAAKEALARAEMVAVTLPTLCELTWVLSRGYKIPADEISAGFRQLIDAANVVVNSRRAHATGLRGVVCGPLFSTYNCSRMEPWIYDHLREANRFWASVE